MRFNFAAGLRSALSIYYHGKQTHVMKTFRSIQSRRVSILVVLVLLLAGCQENFPARAVPSARENKHHEKGDVAIAWYKLQLKIILNANPAFSPMVMARVFGYEGIALYEAVRHENSGSVSLAQYLNQMPVMPAKEHNQGYSWSAVANTVLAKMVRSMYPNLTPQNIASIDSLELAINKTLYPNVESRVVKRSQEYGNAIAAAVLAWAATDGDNQSNTGYVVPVFDGAWVPTPPAFAPCAAPYLGSARPFMPSNINGVAPPPPYAYSTDPESDFYKMAKDLYDVSKNLTEEQRAIALFWNDVGVKKGYTPPGHAISIVNQILEKQNANLDMAAEAYAKVGIALREGILMVWRGKYQYLQLRPVTYIRAVIDSDWMPILGTPAHPEYPAAHAYITGAAMEALTGVFGDHYAFTDHSYDFLGYAPRTYSSLNDAGTESGMSRRFGGIHYLPSINVGLSEGRAVGHEIGKLPLFAK